MVLVQLRSASPQTSMIVYGLLCNVLQNDDDDFSIFSAFFKVMPPSKKPVAHAKSGKEKSSSNLYVRLSSVPQISVVCLSPGILYLW